MSKHLEPESDMEPESDLKISIKKLLPKGGEDPREKEQELGGKVLLQT
jgi:hypothetical protein